MGDVPLGRVNSISDIGLGDRSLSFGQLNPMEIDELEDAEAVVLSLSENSEKWVAVGTTLHGEGKEK